MKPIGTVSEVEAQNLVHKFWVGLSIQKSWFVRFLDQHFKHREIVNCEHEPYLHRWYIFETPWVTMFVHKFERSDEDRALHDHPWSFLVIPIWRGYIEHAEITLPRPSHLLPYTCPIARRVLPILGTRFRSSLYRHRVELVKGKPAWSLFFHFKRTRIWGFWPTTGFMPWNKWWQDNCS